MASGQEIAKALTAAAPLPTATKAATDAFDKKALEYVSSLQIPDYIASNPWPVIKVSNDKHTLLIRVIPDYFALGTDADPYRIKGSPFLAQKIATVFGSILPSAKLVRDIQSAATAKWAYTDVKGKPYGIPLSKIDTNDALVAANNLANGLYQKAIQETYSTAIPGGIKKFGDGLTIGYRKAIVVGPGLDGSKVAIYGGRWTPASGQKDVVQPYSTIHGSSYADYSHGIVLIKRQAVLDGKNVDLQDIFENKDPDINSLVSDKGAFTPTFPNATPGAKPISTTDDTGVSDSVDSVEPVISQSDANADSSFRVAKYAAGVAAIYFGLRWLL